MSLDIGLGFRKASVVVIVSDARSMHAGRPMTEPGAKAVRIGWLAEKTVV
jgi:hypothetical protein